jgi:hypothetical protein
MAGLDPAIQSPFRPSELGNRLMDGRVKPGHDKRNCKPLEFRSTAGVFPEERSDSAYGAARNAVGLAPGAGE